MISMAIGLLGGVETAAASVGKKDADGPAFAETFEQVAGSGRTKVAADGTQGAGKIGRGTGQAKKVGRSGQSDGGVKQADGGLAVAKDGIGVQGGKGATAGKKIGDLTEEVEEQVAGGAGDAWQDLQASGARVGVPGALGQVGQGRVSVAAKDGVGSSQDAAEVEVAGLSNPATAVSGDGAEVFESGVQRTIAASRDGVGRTFGALAVAQEKATFASGGVGKEAVGASIRPDLKGAVDVAGVGLPVATGQARELATAAVSLATGHGSELVATAAPIAAGKNGSEPVVKSLTKVVDESALPGNGVEASSVERDVPAFVPAQSLKAESLGVAASSLQVGGVSVSQTGLRTKQIVPSDAAGNRLEITGGANSLTGGVAVPAGRVTVATSGLKQSVSESAVVQTTSVDASATASALLPGFRSTKGDAAIPVADARGSAVVGASTEPKAGLGLPGAPVAATSIDSGTEGIAVKGDGGLGAGPVSAQASPVAFATGDVSASVAQPAIVSDGKTPEIPSGLPQDAVADARGVEGLKGAVATVVAQPVATAHPARSGQDGAKRTAKSAGRYEETKTAKETSAPSIGDGTIVAEASAAGVAAPAVIAATAAPAAPTVVASQTVTPELTADEAGRGVAALVGTGAGAAPGLQSSGRVSAPGAGVQAAQSGTFAGSVTETVASRVEGPKVAKNSTGQASGIPSDSFLTDAALTEAGQGIESRSQGIVPVEVNGAVAPVAAESSGVAGGGLASVKAGQERKAIGGTASVGGRERKGAAESKAGDVTASAVAVEAGRTVAAASSVDAGVVAAKPASAEHRAPVREGGQVSAAPVASIDGAAVQAHVASVTPANVPAAAPVASSNVSAEGSVGGTSGAHAASAAGAAGESLVSPMAHTTLQATPTVLEVGVPGGTHGWLKIRAEIGEGGAVQASMSASSHAGQDALRRDLPAMNAFLESEHVPVNVQVAHGTGSNWGEKDGAMVQGGLGAGLGSGMGQSAGQDAPGSGREAGAGMLADAGTGGGRQPGAGSNSQSGLAGEPLTRRGVVAQNVSEGEAVWSAAPGYGSRVRANGGSWLNVVA